MKSQLPLSVDQLSESAYELLMEYSHKLYCSIIGETPIPPPDWFLQDVYDDLLAFRDESRDCLEKLDNPAELLAVAKSFGVFKYQPSLLPEVLASPTKREHLREVMIEEYQETLSYFVDSTSIEGYLRIAINDIENSKKT
tara:strand:+ start:16479 stop:16898 length:420 start_codon:yes stop_codon:yes gene_type:complete